MTTTTDTEINDSPRTPGDISGHTRCVLYLRLSDLRDDDLNADGEGKGLVNQERQLREYAARLGWTVTRVIIENDMQPGTRRASAFKRRKIKLPDGRVKLRVVRPGFRAMLDDLARGRADALLTVDLDRTLRDPRDCEDLIDVVHERKLNAKSVSGSLTFTNGGTDSEITMARIMVAMANKSSRDTARRVSAARERQALSGTFGGGRRPFGFGMPKVDEQGQPILDDSGKQVIDYDKIVEREAEVIRQAAMSVLAGVSLRSIVQELRAGDVPTVAGTPWQVDGLRSILLRPRNIAKMVYDGKELEGVVAPWPAILDESTFRAVVAKLTDPARNVNPGPAPRWLGSGLYRCPCGRPMRCHTAGQHAKSPAYRCQDGRGSGHVTRNAAALDEYVANAVIDRLSQPDAASLIKQPEAGPDLAALHRESLTLSARLTDLSALFAEGEINRVQLADGTKRITTKLDAINAQLAEAADVSPLAGLVTADDVREAWEELSLGRKRTVVNALMTVTVLPSRSVPAFDPTTVRITPRL